MKSFFFILIFFCGTILKAQPPANPAPVAGYPVNYNEDMAGAYTLPPLLICEDGSPVHTAKDWIKKRRPELLKQVEQTQFGTMPVAPPLRFSMFDKGSLCFNGKAWRKQVTIYLAADTAGPAIHLLLYTPATIKKKAPLLLHIAFAAPNQLVNDTGIYIGHTWTREGIKIKADKPTSFSKLDVTSFIDAGIGFGIVYYGDIEPDFKKGYLQGIRGRYLKPGQSYVADNEWGAISAWAWGLSRVMDYFEKDKHTDSKRIAIQGASRLGKTVLWAGISDSRFKVVIASISGEGGAAIARRNYGETIQHITDTSRYFYQFAPAYHHYASHINDLPFDAHTLVALLAPRPLLLQTGSTDYWSDPKGEFLAASAATAVYTLFGKEGTGTVPMPTAGNTSLLMNTLGYYMHEGGHTVLPEDWKLFIQYLKKHL